MLGRMTRLFLGVSVLAGAAPALAQEAGDGFLRIGAARTKLVDKGQIFVNEVEEPTAGYETRATHHGVLTAGYYPVNMLAIEASLSSPATTNNIPAGSLAGTPNLGDDEFVVATLGASFHPIKGPVSPYVGGGMQFQFTTQERDGLGVNLNVPNSHGPYVAAGLDYRISPRWGLFAEVRKSWYHTRATGLLPTDATFTSFAAVDANAKLDPLTIQLGATAYFGKAAQAGPSLAADNRLWMVRAGLSTLRLADRAQMVVGGTPLTGESLSTFEHQTISLQIGRFITRNIALNATLGFPPTIDVFGGGSIGALPKLGEVTYGPTALTAQYHFTRSGRIRPYVGAGLSYMIVFATKDGSFGDLKVKNDLGPAFEAGTDIMVNQRWGLFVDVKKALLRPKTSGTFMGAPVSVKTRLDPLVLTGGASFRF